MTTLVFDRTAQTLTVTAGDGAPVGQWPAANNVDHAAIGPWPDGTYDYLTYNPHPGLDTNSDYGRFGIFVFDVPGRTGMGVHAGRATVPDGLGRAGYLHCTMGCIRTIEPAITALLARNDTDPPTTMTVQ
jgi:hypothetical protein